MLRTLQIQVHDGICSRHSDLAIQLIHAGLRVGYECYSKRVESSMVLRGRLGRKKNGPCRALHVRLAPGVFGPAYAAKSCGALDYGKASQTCWCSGWPYLDVAGDGSCSWRVVWWSCWHEGGEFRLEEGEQGIPYLAIEEKRREAQQHPWRSFHISLLAPFSSVGISIDC